MKQITNKATGMFVKFGLPLASVAVMVLAVRSVLADRHDTSLKAPPASPARSPFGDSLSGLGIIEPSTESIEIGAAVPGLVSVVHVKVGQRVLAGAPLFRLDDRALQSDLLVRKAELESARLQLHRLEKLPRPEEIPLTEAKVAEARVNVFEASKTYDRNVTLVGGGSVSQEELIKSKAAYDRAQARLRSAEAELKLQKAGAWQEDLDVARQTVAKAEAVVQQVQTELDRLIVRAPVDGNILQVQVHPGESVSVPANRSLMVLGEIERLFVRVNIDEYEIPRFGPGAPARAFVVGHPELNYPLSFVRIEPFVIPKRSLAGDNRERVDTRVLPVLYEVQQSKGAPLLVGQQVNVYVEVPVVRP
jgi:multidrug efflux pump subunit AcrA (membrane-fusion protein)